MLTQADELVVLSHHLRSSLGEVKGEGSLVGSQVVDVEDEFLGKVLGSSPEDPAHTRVNKTVLDDVSHATHGILRVARDLPCDQRR